MHRTILDAFQGFSMHVGRAMFFYAFHGCRKNRSIVLLEGPCHMPKQIQKAFDEVFYFFDSMNS